MLSNAERARLERVATAATSARRDAVRAELILLAAAGKDNLTIAANLGLNRDTVSRWRTRFRNLHERGLRDAPRTGRPPRFTAEQKARVIQKAIETPRQAGVPITHWSKTELARLAGEAGIVESIHPSTVWRWLHQADLKPHQCRTWLQSTDPDFEERMKDVVNTYLATPQWTQQGIAVFSVDEKTGNQALERKHPNLPMQPGLVERREHEYTRHGTLCLTAGFNVATGEVASTITENRPAPVFAEFVKKLGATVPDAPKIHFVMDQLNTHWHHDVCEVVAALSGVEYDREQHRRGAQRRAFLADTGKRVVFHFTPKHASWLNQVEIWFSTLQRKVIGRGSFTSLDDLREKIVEFIDYHNRALAHPYRWTYTGAPCRE